VRPSPSAPIKLGRVGGSKAVPPGLLSLSLAAAGLVHLVVTLRGRVGLLVPASASALRVAVATAKFETESSTAGVIMLFSSEEVIL
jgi:hypothetical protein